ncbi:MAG TPA: PLP-dependent aminotransferase family protein [Solirubrobacteraceae bacterium]
MSFADFVAVAGADVIALSGGFPDLAALRGPDLAHLAGQLFRGRDADATGYAGAWGVPGFLKVLRERLRVRDGQVHGPGELMVTSGATEGLHLAATALLTSADQVLIESPTFPGAAAAFEAAGARLGAIEVDEDGVRVDRIGARLDSGDASSLCYVVPDHQNPTGATLSLERRRSLAGLARRHDLLIIEDVAYRELDFKGPRLPSLASLAPGHVVQLGTFSKTFMPGIRLGWAAGPRSLLERLVEVKRRTDQCASPFGQRLLESFVRRGGFDAQIAEARVIYRRRCEAMLAALAETMPAGVTWSRPCGGFFVWLSLPAGVPSAAVATVALDRGVACIPGELLGTAGGLRLAFSAVAAERMPEAGRRLGEAIAAVSGTATSSQRLTAVTAMQISEGK